MFAMPETTKRGEAKATACAGIKNPDLFFPTSESSGIARPTAAERIALNICAQCPIAARRACLTDELSRPIGDQYGVAGGTTAAQRRAILRGRQAARAAHLAEVA